MFTVGKTLILKVYCFYVSHGNERIRGVNAAPVLYVQHDNTFPSSPQGYMYITKHSKTNTCITSFTYCITL